LKPGSVAFVKAEETATTQTSTSTTSEVFVIKR
jgi:hypothetical protein